MTLTVGPTADNREASCPCLARPYVVASGDRAGARGGLTAMRGRLV